MSLSRTEKITLISTFGVAIFTVLVHLGIRFYFQPDLRYDLGSYYFSNNNAITYIKFTNYGKSDAEDVALNVEFPTAINDFSTDNPLVTLEIDSGGKSHNNLVGRIPSIHPNQSVTIYFSVEHKNNTEVNANFLKQSTYKDGIPSTGRPVWLTFIFALTFYAVILIPFYLYTNKQKNRHYEIIKEILRVAQQSSKDNQSKEEFMDKVNITIGKTKFRKKGLLQIAESAFTVHRQKNNG